MNGRYCTDRFLHDSHGLIRKAKRDLIIRADINCHFAAVCKATKQQFVSERAADGVLNQPRHGARTHQWIEAFPTEIGLEFIGEHNFDLLLMQLIFQLHEKFVDHAQDNLFVQRREGNDGIKTVAEFRRVVDKFLMQLEDQLHEKKVEIVFTDELKAYLGSKGFDP